MDFDPTTADPSKGVAPGVTSDFDPNSADPAKALTRDDYVRTLAKDEAFDPSDVVSADRDLALKVFRARATEPVTFGDVVHGTGAFLKGFGMGLYRMPLTIAKGIHGLGRVTKTVGTSAMEGKTSFGAPGTPEQAAQEPPEVKAARAEASGAILSLGTDIQGQVLGLKRNGSRLLSLITGGNAGHLDKELSDDDIAALLKEQAQIKSTQMKIESGNVKGAFADRGFTEEAKFTAPPNELAAGGYSGEEAAAMGSTFNPELAIPFHKILRPGMIAPIASRGLRAAGNVVKGAGTILDNPITRRTSHYAPMYGIVHGAATGDFSHILKYVALTGVPAVGRGLRGAGEFVAEAGREMALSPSEQAMFSAFREASGTMPGKASQFATRSLQRSAAGAISMAPFAATAQTPEEAGEALGGGAALGLVGGTAHDAASSTALAARKALFDSALKTTTNGGKQVIDLSRDSFDYGHDPALDQLHTSMTATMDPESVGTINQWRHLEQGRTDIYVLPEAAFDARYPGVSAHGKADVVNGRRVILFRGTEGVRNALAHEPLHPVYQNLSPEAKAAVDQASLSRTDPSEFASRYYSVLMQKPMVLDFDLLPDTSATGPSKAGVLEEMAADTMRNLTIDQITNKPSLKRQFQIGIGRAMESLGLPTTTEEVRGIIGVQPTFKAIATLEAALRQTARTSEDVGPQYGTKPGAKKPPGAAATPASTTPAPKPPVTPGGAPQPAVAPGSTRPVPVAATPQPKSVSPDAIRDAVAAMIQLKFKKAEAQQRVAAAANEAAHLGLDVTGNDLLAHALSGKFPKKATSPASAPTLSSQQPQKIPSPRSEAPLIEKLAEPGAEPRLAGFLWDKVIRGDVSVGDMPSQLLLEARESIRTGQIKNPEDFEAFLESKRSPSEASSSDEPPSAPARKPSATPPVESGGMANALPEAMSDDTAAAINRAGEEAARNAVGSTRKGKEIERARVSAMAEHHADVAGDPDLVTHRIDSFGKPSITGRRLDQADPLHNRLIANAELKPRDVEIANRLAASAGRNVALLDYGSAPVAEEVSGVSRKKEQAAAPAQKRAAGEAPMRHADKNFIPSTIVYNHGSGQNKPSILVRGFSPDKFLHNARQLFPWLEANGFLKGEDGKPFYSGPDDPKLAEDFRAMAANHANGYTGMGDAQVKGTPFTRVKTNLDYAPTKIPLDRFRVVNALVGAPYPETGATPRQADIRALSKLNAPEPGGNPIWQKLGEEKALLESTIENVKPELVGDLHEEADPSKAIRQSGKLEGAPRQDFAAAGFMPKGQGEKSPLPDDAHAEAEKLGLKYKGLTMGKLPTFDDPETGSTITLAKARTPQDVKSKVEASRETFRRDLLALHNTSPEGIRAAAGLRGIPLPSLGIIKADLPFHSFGNISLVGDRSMIDPAIDSTSRVFASDLYSMRQPHPTHAIKSAKIYALENEIAKVRPDWYEVTPGEGPYAIREWVRKGVEGNKGKAFDQMSGSYMMKAIFADEVLGKKIAEERVPEPLHSPEISKSEAMASLYAKLGEKDFQNARPGEPSWNEISKAVREAIEESVVRKAEGEEPDEMIDKMVRDGLVSHYLDDKDQAYFGPMGHVMDDLRKITSGKTVVARGEWQNGVDSAVKGHEEQFEQWLHGKLDPIFSDPTLKVRGRKMPYTIDNVVDAMIRRSARAQEDSMTKSLGFARAKAVKEFKSVDEMKRSKSRIVSHEEFERAKDEVDKLFFEAENAISHAYRYGREGFNFDRLDSASVALGDYLKGPKTDDGMRRALSRNDFDTSKLDADDIGGMRAAAHALAEMPTEYFEAKLHRAVSLGDFAGAVIPEGTPADVRAALERSGLDIETYSGTAGNAERTDAVKRLAARNNAMFMPRNFFEEDATWLHGGPAELEGGQLKRGGKKGWDSGAIFLSKDAPEQRKYAAGYGAGGMYRVKVDLKPDEIFDYANPEHIDRVADIELPDGENGYDFLRTAESSARFGAIDWTAIDEDVLGAAGFKAAILAERPKGFGNFKEDIYSLAVFNPERVKIVGKLSPEEHTAAQREAFTSDDGKPLGAQQFMPRVDDLGFYSQLEKTLEEKMPNKASADQIRGIISKGAVKADEIKWSGLDDFLKENPAPTKAEVLDYLKANNLQVKEVVKAGENEMSDAVLVEPHNIMVRQTDATYLDPQEGEHFDPDTAEKRLTLEAKNAHTGESVQYYVTGSDDAGSWRVEEEDPSRQPIDHDFRSVDDAMAAIKEHEADRLTTENRAALETPERAAGDVHSVADLAAEFRGRNYTPDEAWNEALETFAQTGEDRSAAIERMGFRYRGSTADGGETQFHHYQLPGGENYRELLFTVPIQAEKGMGWQDYHNAMQQKGVTPREADEVRRFFVGAPRETIDLAAVDRAKSVMGETFMNKYRAVLDGPISKTVPVTQNTFNESHWREPNVVAHTRFNDRTGPDGENLLHIEEIQSDWHQKGRRKGYDTPRSQEEMDLSDEYERVNSERKDMIRSYGFKSGGELNMKRNESHPNLEAARKENSEFHKRLSEIGDKMGEFIRARKDAVPDAPFKKSWPEFVMKRMIRWAAENGYDGITWTTGDQQAERYDLSHHIDEIKWQKSVHIPGAENDTIVHLKPKNDSPIGLQVDPNGKVVESNGAGRQFEGRDLADVIGKDIAAKIAAKESGRLSGEGLRVGGEGMRAFYDKMLPNIANDIGKKFGAKVSEIKIGQILYAEYLRRIYGADVSGPGIRAMERNGKLREEWLKSGSQQTVHHLPITDAMRESVMAHGQARFMPRGEFPPAEAIAEPPDLTRVPFKGAVSHKKRRLEDIPALAGGRE